MKTLNILAAAKLEKSVVSSVNAEMAPLTLVVATVFISVAMPILLKKFSESALHSGERYRLIWAAALALNCICVSIPGRFDGEMVDGKISVVWKSAFAPSGWVFAIWGIIYLAELLATSYVSLAPSSWTFGDTVTRELGVKLKSFWGGEQAIVANAVIPSENIAFALRGASLYWLAGNVYQSLWCFIFRRKFMSYLWLPAMLLAFGSISLFGAHAQISQAIDLSNSLAARNLLRLLRFPISLHATWLTAASLLNLNGWVTVAQVAPEAQLSIATASAYAAGLFGSLYSLHTRDSFIGLTAAWALTALADKTARGSDVVGTMGNVAVRSLALTEQSLAIATALVSVLAPFSVQIFHLVQGIALRQK